MEKIKKYLTQRNRNILSIIIIVLGTIFLIYYSFYTPSYINEYIATNIYKTPANNYFDDENFYNCVIRSYNIENQVSFPYTSNLTDTQLSSIKEIECLYKEATSTKGLEKMTALTSLVVSWNNLTEIDVSKNTALTELDVSENKLTELDVSKNTALTFLDVSNNKLVELDVSKNTALTQLWVDNSQLTELDVSKNTALTELLVSENKLPELDVSKNTALTQLWVRNNQLAELDVSKNTALTELDVSENKLTELDVSKNTALNHLLAHNNQLTELDVSKNTALNHLLAHNNQLTELDVSKNTALTLLWVDNNQLTELDVSKNTALTELDVTENKLPELDVSKNTKLKYFKYEKNLFSKCYTLLNKQFTLDNRIILPNRWTTSLDNQNLNILKMDGNKINPIATGRGEIHQSIYNEENKALKTYYISSGNYSTYQRYFIYVYNITSDNYIIDDDNIYVDTNDNKEILSNINFDYGGVDGYTNTIENNKLIIKHGDRLVKEYNLVNFEITSNDYFIEDNIIKYIDEFDINNVNINYGTKEVINNKLVIKYNDKVIKEYNLVKLEVTSDNYTINRDNIIYANNLDIDKININYGTKEIVDNKLVIKYNDKVIKEYTLYKINSTYPISKDTIYIEDYMNKEEELNECYKSCSEEKDQVTCADECDEKYNNYNDILNNITSDDLELSISDNKLVCKLNNNTIKTFNISKEKEYLEITNYIKNDEKKIISKIVNGTNVDVFKNNILTNIDYNIKDKNNNIITDRNLRTGDKIIFNQSDNNVEYILSVIGDVQGDGKVDVKDIRKIANFIVGNETLEPVYEISADVDSSTNVDIKDIRKIAKYIVNGSEL